MADNDTVALLAELKELKESFNILASNSDSFFLILNGMIIYFMQCGFAFLECGAVRSKNATNILIKNILDSFAGGMAYWIIGYPLAFGSGNIFLGHEYWASYGLPIDKFSHWFFQFVFAATATTIVSGAMAERTAFSAYFVYSFLITGFIYPVVTHWAWSDGWLAAGMTVTLQDGANYTTTYQDFAGSGVVHLVGGTAAFVGAAIIGPRIGRFDDKRKAQYIPGHSIPMACLGAFILFFGFFAFNGGSQGQISAKGDANAVALAVVNTIISACFAALTALIIRRISSAWFGDKKGHWSVLVAINAALTGMVAICAGCNVFHPWSAAAVGTCAGMTYLCYSALMIKIKVDDPLDAVAVHAGGGLWGVISVPLFAMETGLVFKWNAIAGLDIAWNLIGAFSIIAWSGVLTGILFGVLKCLGVLRVDRDLELLGLDLQKHGEPAYPVEAYDGSTWTPTLPPEIGTRRPSVAYPEGLQYQMSTKPAMTNGKGHDNPIDPTEDEDVQIAAL